MKRRLQFAEWIACVAVCASLAVPGVAQQKSRPAAPVKQDRPQFQPKTQQPKGNPNRPSGNAPNRTVNRPPMEPPPGARGNAGNGQRGNQNAREQLGVGAPGQWVQRMRSLPPAQRDRFFQSSPAFHNLPPEKQSRIRQQFNQWDRMTPAQRQDQMAREENWRRLTPDQKAHIRNDVLPSWRHLPADRQQAIQRRLQVLQNMPESARNQRLNDPRFTEGMNEEDKAMLHDLSHMHIGGPPDPPVE